jgi:hypothetical protein
MMRFVTSTGISLDLGLKVGYRLVYRGFFVVTPGKCQFKTLAQLPSRSVQCSDRNGPVCRRCVRSTVDKMLLNTQSRVP